MLFGRSFAAALVISIAVGCSSSDSGYVYPIPLQGTRQVQEIIWLIDNGEAVDISTTAASGTAPLEVGFLISMTLLPADNQHGRDFVTKRLVDFGDGAGWEDVTQLHRSFDDPDIMDGVDAAELVRHTYTEPGEYIIRVRATYWDGEVVVCDEHTTTGPPPVRVTVTEPAAP